MSFSGFMGNESELGTNKSREPRKKRLLRSTRLRRQTFMFLFCLLCIIKVCPTSSADLYVFVLSFVYY